MATDARRTIAVMNLRIVDCVLNYRRVLDEAAREAEELVALRLVLVAALRLEVAALRLEVEVLRLVLLEGAAVRLVELVAALRLVLVEGDAVVVPRLVVEVTPEALVVRVVVSCEPVSLTRLLTVVWLVAALVPELVALDLAALLPEVVVVLRVVGVVVAALRPVLPEVVAVRLVLLEVAAVRLVLLDVAAVRLLLPEVAAAVRLVPLLAVAAVREVLLALREAGELLLVTAVDSYFSRTSRALAVRLVLLDAIFALRTVNERSGYLTP